MTTYSFSCKEYKNIPLLPFIEIKFDNKAPDTFEINSVIFKTIDSKDYKFEVGESYDKLLHIIIDEKIKIRQIYVNFNKNFTIYFTYIKSGIDSSVHIFKKS